MEVIRIPQVSLVDATGRRIGVYTDDPDWWQQLKLKHQNNQLAITNGPDSNNTNNNDLNKDTTRTVNERAGSANSLNKDAGPFGSTTKLIKDDKNSEIKDKQIEISTIPLRTHASNNEENQRECNMIGETPLHIAIMYDDLNTIKFLIEVKGFDVNQRSVGGKFTGGFNNKITANLIQQSKYEGLAYYGEYPLAFASCFANKEIYDYLVEKGADPNLQGYFIY